MSKVKITDVNAHTKAKLRHNLRRKETAKIKKDRIENKNFSNKFYVKKDRGIYEKVTKIIPAHQEMQSRIVLQRCYHVNRDGTVETWSEPICRKELVMVPEQTRTYSRYIGNKDIKPYIKQRSRRSKKWLRKVSNRKVRHAKCGNYSGYKKVYDLWWMYY